MVLKRLSLIFCCCCICSYSQALIETGGDRERLVRKILKLQVENALKTCILEHTFEQEHKGKGTYPVERRELQNIPACKSLLEMLGQIAGPHKVDSIKQEYNEALKTLNNRDPRDYSDLWAFVAGAVAVVGAGVGAVVAAPFVLPVATVALFKTAIAGCATAAVTAGSAMIANPLTTINCASTVLHLGLKLFSEKTEGELQQEVNKLKKIKNSHAQLEVELRFCQADKADQMDLRAGNKK